MHTHNLIYIIKNINLLIVENWENKGMIRKQQSFMDLLQKPFQGSEPGLSPQSRTNRLTGVGPRTNLRNGASNNRATPVGALGQLRIAP